MDITAVRRHPLLIPLLVAALALSMWAWKASAATGEASSTLVTISPARILDTRDGSDIGLPGPFMSDASQQLTVTGAITTPDGDVVIVPVGATGVLLNVTSVRSSSDGFVAIRPGDATGEPTTSNLNFAAGQQFPNAVTVALPTTGDAEGTINIFFKGATADDSTDLLIDIVGYTQTAGGSSGGVVLDGVENVATVELDHNEVATVLSLPFIAPSNGVALLDAGASVSDAQPNAKIFCSITTGDTLDAPVLTWESAGGNGGIGQLAGTRKFDVATGANEFNLVCQSTASDNGAAASVEGATITLTFVPA